MFSTLDNIGPKWRQFHAHMCTQRDKKLKPSLVCWEHCLRLENMSDSCLLWIIQENTLGHKIVFDAKRKRAKIKTMNASCHHSSCHCIQHVYSRFASQWTYLRTQGDKRWTKNILHCLWTGARETLQAAREHLTPHMHDVCGRAVNHKNRKALFTTVGQSACLKHQDLSSPSMWLLSFIHIL